MKTSYVFTLANDGITAGAGGGDLSWLRAFMGMPNTGSDNPMLDPFGDVVLAAILRWHWLRAMLTGSDLGAATFAAGVIQARTQLNDQLFWHTAENKWTLELSCRAWTSWAMCTGSARQHARHRRHRQHVPHHAHTSPHRIYTETGYRPLAEVFYLRSRGGNICCRIWLLGEEQCSICGGRPP